MQPDSAQHLRVLCGSHTHAVDIIVGMADSPTTTSPPLPPAPPPDPRTPRSSQDPPPPTGPLLSQPKPPPRPLPHRWLPATLAVGVVAAATIGRVPLASVGTAAFVVACAAVLRLTNAVASRSGRWCLLGSVGFALLLVARTDPRLAVFNAITSVLLLVVAAIGPARIYDWKPLQLMNDALSIAFQPFVMLGDLVVPTGAGVAASPTNRSDRRQLAIGILQGSVIAVPLLIVLAALLGSADAVFADLLSRGQFDAGQLWYAALRFSVGAVVILVLLGRTVRPRTAVPPAGISLDRIPTLVVLGALNGIFALFVIAQLYALTSAGEQILVDAGLTYRDYARQGFFQLLWVSGLTLLALLSLRSAAERWFTGDRWFRWSSLTTIVLTFGVVAVAFGRLQLYIADDGLTPLRFYSSVFSIWVAMGFVIVAVRLIGWRSSIAWTLPALVASGFVALAALNVVNPEARIADNLVARQDPDVVIHMQKLTADGQLVMARRFDEINSVWAADVAEQLCAEVPADEDWLSWNLGRSRARSALLELC